MVCGVWCLVFGCSVPASSRLGPCVGQATVMNSVEGGPAAQVSRREFAVRMLALGIMPFVRIGDTPTGPTVRIGAMGVGPRSPAWMGLTLGIEEAQHAASLFGGSVMLVSTPDDDWSNISAVVGAGDTSACVAAAGHSATSGVAFFNTACDDDELRGSRCARTMFHVTASDAMRRDTTAGHDGAHAVIWDPSLERFGADTLNRRFQTRFGTPMTEGAWATWMATKIIWETALRARSGDAPKLLTTLSQPSVQFDGHKGVPLSFRPWDRQLRQPLYLVAAGKAMQIPADGSRDALDALGPNARTTTCKEPS
jgi:hypothetical protein